MASLSRMKPASLSKILYVCLFTLLFITFAAKLIPFSPVMPKNGVDPSWQLALSELIKQHITFGINIVYSYGPYGFFGIKAYHPYTDRWLMSGMFYFTALYWSCSYYLMKEAHWGWILLFLLLIPALTYHRDTFWLTLPLLINLVIYKLVTINHTAPLNIKPVGLCIILMFGSLGFISLIKHSFLFLSLFTTLSASAFLLYHQQKALAALCFLSFLISIIGFLLLAGIPLSMQTTYLARSLTISYGYTDAMSISNRIIEIVMYVVGCLFLLSIIIKNNKRLTINTFFLLYSFSIFLFLVFKESFARHDAEHIICAISCFLLASLLLPFIIKNKAIPYLIVYAIFFSLYVENHYKLPTPINKLTSTYITAWNGLHKRILYPTALFNEYERDLAKLHKMNMLPLLTGTSDIYPFDQALLIASQNTWSPRPVFQSHMAYTPILSELNRKHLTGDNAPDNIFFQIRPIDNKFPSLDDGPSWPVLLTHYEPRSLLSKNMLILKKKTHQEEMPIMHVIEKQIHHFGEQVKLPQSDSLLYATIDIKKTFLGKLVSLFLKPSQLRLIVHLKNGEKKKFRFIPSMAKSNFLLSPLITNSADFVSLYRNDDSLNDRKVQSIIIEPKSDPLGLWGTEFAISFSQLKIKKERLTH